MARKGKKKGVLTNNITCRSSGVHLTPEKVYIVGDDGTVRLLSDILSDDEYRIWCEQSLKAMARKNRSTVRGRGSAIK